MFDAVWPRGFSDGMIWITLCKPTLAPSHFYACHSKRSHDRMRRFAAKKTSNIPLMIKVTHIQKPPRYKPQRAGEGALFGPVFVLTSSSSGLSRDPTGFLFCLAEAGRRRAPGRESSSEAPWPVVDFHFLCVSLRGLSSFMGLSLDHRDLLGSPVICCQRPKSSDC